MARVAAVITVVVITLVALVGLAIVGATADIATDSSGLERQVFEPAPADPATVAGIPPFEWILRCIRGPEPVI